MFQAQRFRYGTACIFCLAASKTATKTVGTKTVAIKLYIKLHPWFYRMVLGFWFMRPSEVINRNPKNQTPKTEPI